MRHLEADARAVRDQVDVLASERCSVSEIAYALDLREDIVRSAIWLGPSKKQFRREPRLAAPEKRRKKR